MSRRRVLSDEQVAQVKAQYIRGEVGYETLAKRFGVGVSTIRDILTYRARYAA